MLVSLLLVQDFVDYSAPPLWGITNKSSLFNSFSPKIVHAALQPFMILVSGDEPLFASLLQLNTNMSALWDCAHNNPTACPSILKSKLPLLGRASNKNARGQAAAGLLISLWDTDFPKLKSILKEQLLLAYPKPQDADSSDFVALFSFRVAPETVVDLHTIGNTLSSRPSRSQKPSKVEKPKVDVDNTNVKTVAPGTVPPVSNASSTQQIALKSIHDSDIPCTPAAHLDLSTLVKRAKKVFLKPCAPVKLEWLRSLNLVPNKTPKTAFRDLVMRKFLKLVDKSADGILVGRIFFDYAETDEEDDTINYDIAYVQPGVITLPSPISDSYTNFLDVYWFSATNGDITVPYEQNLQFISDSEPFLQLHSWDMLNANPTSVFSTQAYSNGLLLFPPLSAFIEDVNKSEQKISEEKMANAIDISKVKSTSVKEVELRKDGEKSRKSSRRSPSPEAQQKKKRSMDIKKQLLPVLEVVLEQVEGIPKQVQFLDVHGNWPLCKTLKCKKTGKYAVYSEGASMKPKYCGGCRPNDMVHVHYNNLRVHLQSKGLLENYVVDTRDANACTAFGKELTRADNATSSSDNECEK